MTSADGSLMVDLSLYIDLYHSILDENDESMRDQIRK